MSFEESIRQIIREEIRSALAERPTTNAPELLSLSEVRKHISVSKSTLKTWIADGKLPSFRAGRIVRVKLEDVRRVLTERKAPQAVDPSDRASAILASLGAKR